MKIQFLQDVIDRLRGKIYCADIFLLNEYNIKQRRNFESLILGSSHLYCFCPNEKELNVALPSQDLYYSYKLYQKLNHKDLKNIIISFSVFSPAYCLIKTKDTKMCVLYKVSLGIDYEYPELLVNKNVRGMEKYFGKALGNLRRSFTLDKYKKRESHIIKEESVVKERALKHYKNNVREVDEMDCLKKLLNEAKFNKQNVLVVLPPATSIYKNVLPKSDMIFEKLYTLLNDFDNVKLLNLYDSEIFTDEDFADADHLKKECWEKYSDIIRKQI